MITEEQLSRARILIVDDELPNVLVLEKILERGGYTNVRFTTNPREALDLYHELQPDLVLLDLNMPHLDGFAIMERLEQIERDSYVPVLVLTGLPDQEVRLRALRSGARDFLNKPFAQAEVLARIRNLIEVRLLHNAVRERNKMLEEMVRERTSELRETQLDIVRRLGRAAEYRDDNTGLHVMRVSLYASLLGREEGMSEEECELLLHAAPMHDVGKIGIPDRILLKPGPLEEAEWETMKAHVEIGVRLLSGGRSELMEMAELIALTHQEKWDGSGYPRGLKGEEIPLAGRICALCDVFDALTSDRPYKKAWSVEEAIAEIEEQSGKHFDPKLVKHFKRMLPEILQIREYFSDSSSPTPASEGGF